MNVEFTKDDVRQARGALQRLNAANRGHDPERILSEVMAVARRACDGNERERVHKVAALVHMAALYVDVLANVAVYAKVDAGEELEPASPDVLYRRLLDKADSTIDKIIEAE